MAQSLVDMLAQGPAVMRKVVVFGIPVAEMSRCKVVVDQNRLRKAENAPQQLRSVKKR